MGVLGVGGAVIAWLVTRWRVVGPELHIEMGLLRRQSLRVPASRIQSVDIVRPALARAIGLAEVRIDVAGHGRNKTRLAYLTDGQAEGVRARLLALAHGVVETAPAPPRRRIFTVRNGRLLASVLLGFPTVGLGAVVVVVLTLSAISSKAAPPSAGVFLADMFILVAAIARRFAAQFDLRVDEAADGLHVSAGLMQTRSETVPFARLQGVRYIRPLLWRPFGWVRLDIDVARQGGDRRGGNRRTESRALLPVGSAEEAGALLERVVPGAVVGLGTGPGARAGLPPGARVPGRAVLVTPLSYRNLAAWHDGSYAYARTGRLRRTLTVVPLVKAQSIRWVQGPVARALRLATVHVDVAGRGWHAVARSRDASQAAAAFAELAELAHCARAAGATQAAGTARSRIAL
ncbi:MAG: PH domain-containing protein [Mycobacteriales bacterium]